MKCETVIVRTCENEPIVMLVWDSDFEHVCVCDKQIYGQLEAGTTERRAIGFHREEVYFYDKKLLDDLTKNYRRNPNVWNRLTVWMENDER